MKILRTTDRNFRYDFSKVYKDRLSVPDTVQKSVATILDDVKRMGDQSLLKYTERYDHHSVDVKAMEVTPKERATGMKGVGEREIRALKVAAKRIEEFSKHHPLKSWETKKDGVTLGLRYTPLKRIGIYVPGGKASYPSTVLMTAIPARVAGVGEIIMCSPWPGGEPNAAVLAAAKIAGVDRIFKIGGAQAIGAMAYGTKTIPQVDKIVGPGNLFVTWAKKMVYGLVDIDMLAGPSEICVLADGSVPANFVAADLLAQAEHDQRACPLVITNNANYASRVEGEVRIQLAKLVRKQIAAVAIQKQGMVVLVRNLEEGIDLINELAPEHLELALADPESYVEKIRNAGAIFLGGYSPEAIGDYIAGPSHVLPTHGTARFFSLLTANDFLKATSIQSFSQPAFKKVAADASRLAHLEGFSAHARAIEIRMR